MGTLLVPNPRRRGPTGSAFRQGRAFRLFLRRHCLLCAWLYRRGPERTDWAKLITTAVVVVALIGALDEYHQSFTPGRSGNDPFDWLADLLGATAGAFAFKRIHHLLK
ncbi:MAG: hypothetical protein RLZZ214_2231 [Verrucomicrobiota bacterium]